MPGATFKKDSTQGTIVIRPFKNCKTAESTANKMSDEKLIEYITSKFG